MWWVNLVCYNPTLDIYLHFGAMFGENWRFFTNEPIGLDKKLDMEECSRMGIRSTKGGKLILTGVHFEFPYNSLIQCVDPNPCNEQVCFWVPCWSRGWDVLVGWLIELFVGVGVTLQGFGCLFWQKLDKMLLTIMSIRAPWFGHILTHFRQLDCQFGFKYT